MNKALKTALITIVVVQLIVLVVFLKGEPANVKAEFGAGNFIFGVILFVPALTLSLIKKTKNEGLGILLASGIMLLTGFGLCSVSS